MELDLRRLRFFVEVVRHGGFSQAAKVVFASQPAVSKAVKQLEEELGVRLLDRVGRRSELTVAGKMVYARALGFLAQGEDLITELDELRGLKRGTLRVGFPRLGTSALFVPMYVAFTRRYPGVDVKVSVHTGKSLEDALRAGEIDLAVMIEPISADFSWQHLRTDPLVVLLPSAHPLAGNKKVSLGRLANLPFILHEEGFVLNEIILGACADKGISPKVAARSSQTDFIYELVAAGVGIAFLPRALAEQRLSDRVRVVALDEKNWKWRIALAWRQAAYLSQAAEAWVALARELKAS